MAKVVPGFQERQQRKKLGASLPTHVYDTHSVCVCTSTYIHPTWCTYVKGPDFETGKSGHYTLKTYKEESVTKTLWTWGRTPLKS